MNPLACQCISPIQCALWCGREKFLNPFQGCQCITQEDFAAENFPAGTTKKDIKLSEKLAWDIFFWHVENPEKPKVVAVAAEVSDKLSIEKSNSNADVVKIEVDEKGRGP